MRSSSEKARKAILAVVDEAVSGKADLASLASELFTLTTAIDSDPALKRMLTEPSVPVEAKQTLLHRLLDGKSSGPTGKVAQASVNGRWSHVRDLPDALEYAAVMAFAALADQEGRLGDVEDELFRLGRLLEVEPRLRDTLIDRTTPLEARQQLIRELLDGKAHPVTVALVSQAVRGRRRSLRPTLAYFQTVVAARGDRMVATAWVAAPLSDPHRERIVEALAKQYSHGIQLNEIVDPRVLGGVRVSIGDDLIDSTIETRLALARRRLVH